MKTISLSGVDKSDLKAISALIELNADIFADAVMSYFRGEREYEYQSDTFEVTNIDNEVIEFCVDVQYYAGCKDMNHLIQKRGSAGYEISGGYLEIHLDETEWILDN